MMRIIITATIVFFLTLQAFGQNYKYVRVETLNVRENAGKKYNVIGQINKGDKITELSRFMHKINTKYASYFNWRESRVGYVFRDRFKSEPILDEKY